MVSIAFVVSSLGMGGIERVTTTIANNLALRGFDVTLVNLSHRKDFFPVRTQRYLRPGWFSYNWWRVRRKVSRLFCKNENRYTLEPWVCSLFKGGRYDYIILNPELFVFFDIVRRLHPESKVFLWMHNNYDIYINKYFKKQHELLLHAVKEADGIICLESYSAQRWKRWNENVRLIYNPLTLIDRGHRSSLHIQTIAAASRLVKEHKGLDYLLAVAESLPDDWRISLAGDGDDRAWLQSEIVDRGLTDKLVLRGALDDESLDEHYANASIFLSTSRWEGFPLVAAEAMSRGLPFVSFDIPAMREVTKGGKYGFLVPLGDVKQMNKVLEELMESDDLREEYSRLSLIRVKDFSLNKIIEKWIDFIEETDR